MSVLEDTAIFAAVVQQGGFSHAARYLGLSNGMISRRIANLEKQLNVSLITRTTRHLQLTPEGELLWEHAKRIQQEMDSALSVIQTFTEKPKGGIRISAPISFGQRFLVPLFAKFMQLFPDIKIDLILTNLRLNPMKENLDFVIRGHGFVHYEGRPTDSNLKSRLLIKHRLGVYASPEYLAKSGEPQEVADLSKHAIIGFIEKIHMIETETWGYHYKNKKQQVLVSPKFNCNESSSSIQMCVLGVGIGRFSERLASEAIAKKQLKPILTQYDWGDASISAFYAQQEALPKRTRLLLDFIIANFQGQEAKI